MKIAQDTVRKLRARIAGMAFLRWLLTLSAWWVFLWGGVVLILRAVFDAPVRQLLWGGTGLAPLFILALVLAFRKRPSPAALTALLDSRNKCGGLLMVSDVAGIESWEASMPESVAGPRIQWRGGRTFLLFLAGCVFCVGCFLAPAVRSGGVRSGQLNVGDLVEDLETKIEVLEEQAILDKKRADELKEKLEVVWAEASGDDPVKSWEALDHIDKTVLDEAQKAALEALSETEDLSKALSIGKELDSVTKDQGGNPQLTAAMKEYAALLNELGLDKKLANAANKELANACQNMKLTPEQLKQIMKNLKSCSMQTSSNMCQMAQAGLIDEKMLKKCKQCAGSGDAELAAFLSENADSALAAMISCSMPGKPGISRGRGDAAMSWKNATKEEGAGFKEKTLSPVALSDLKKSKLVGMSYAAPEKSDKKGVSAPGKVSGVAAHGGSAHRHMILPKHKGAVEQYFERKK